MITSSPLVQEVNVINATFTERQLYAPTVYYTISEVLVSIFAIVGNSLVITVFCKERRLRRRTNYYIVSLAAADLLVGLLGIPFALLASIGLPTNLHACLFTCSLLVVLCTISIFCLVAVSVDRYWAILHPMAYSRHVRTKTALVIISICWFTGCFIGFLPLMGWHQNVPNNVQCYFLKVMDHNYLVFLYIVTIITPSLLLAASYAHIYRVILKQLRQIVTMNPGSNCNSTGGTMLRMLGDSRKREVKATQNLSIIVCFFMICWIPLYTINFILAFCSNCFEVNSTLLLFCIILSHLNSAGNPLLYAYHLRDFRAALQIFLYKVFGFAQQPPSTPRINGRHCFGNSSNVAFQNYYSRYRAASLRESRSAMTICQQAKYLTDSQLSLAQKLSMKTRSLPTPKVSSLVTQTAALAAVPTGETGREIWRISENPSISEEDSRRKPSSEESRNRSQKSLSENSTYKYDVTSSLSKLKSTRFSLSSPQLNRSLFIMDAESYNENVSQKYPRSASLADEKTTKTFNLLENCAQTKSFEFLLNEVCSNNGKTKLSQSKSSDGDEIISRKMNCIGVN